MLPGSNRLLFYAVILSMAVHAMGFVLFGQLFNLTAKRDAHEPKNEFFDAELLQPAEKTNRPKVARQVPVPQSTSAADPAIQLRYDHAVTTPVKPRSMAAPQVPTAEEWAFAAHYTLKNSKGYRYTWGKQVRSMMGAAVEGYDQGLVRFRVEIAPNGTLAKLETLWSTSSVVEQLARRVIQNLPPLPPTPTGKPLIFERTITFLDDTADSPPTYKDDCLPDPPVFESPYTWDGKAPWVPPKPKPVEEPDPQVMEACLKQLPSDSIEAEIARSQELLDRWGTRQDLR